MFRDLTETSTLNLLAKGLGTSALRHKVISNNIANVNTPGFKRQVVSFEDEMAKVFDGRPELAGKRTDDRHIPIDNVNYMDVTPSVTTDRVHIMRNDRNNVDIDVEMADLSKNTMLYQIESTRLASMFSDLNDIITRGGRV